MVSKGASSSAMCVKKHHHRILLELNGVCPPGQWKRQEAVLRGPVLRASSSLRTVCIAGVPPFIHVIYRCLSAKDTIAVK